LAVIVEPVLTEEKLRELLAAGHEESGLDYKSALNLADRHDIVELAKDLGAMQAEELGGFVVIGVDNFGKLLPASMPSTQLVLFDESKLRAKMKNYLPEPFDLRTATHVVNGNSIVLIYIGPSALGWCVFATDGVYRNSKGKDEIVFRAGDVFVRHGTASERWQQPDIDRLLKRVIAARKEEWRTEITAEVFSIISRGPTAEDTPDPAVTWQLDTESFDSLILRLLQRGDDIPLRQFLLRIPTEASRQLGEPDDLGVLLDRLASFAAISLAYERSAWVEKATEAFVDVYDLGFDTKGFSTNVSASAKLWLSILERIYGLGGLAVRQRDWSSVRLLATGRGTGHDFDYYPNWLRHGLTMAARADLIDATALIAGARNAVRAVKALHPDLDPEDDRVLNSICQFDALGALVNMGQTSSLDSKNFYTNFARYDSQRTEPAFVAIVSDTAMRTALFDGDDRLLAEAIDELSKKATSEGFRFNGWDGLRDRIVIGFVRRHLPAA
jgi:hypothetical protein